MTAILTSNVDLVVEVIDALLHPSFDGDHHLQHVEAISEFLGRQPEDGAGSVLLEARERFAARHGVDPMCFALEPDIEASAIAGRLKSYLPHWPIYLYHGTVVSRLPSISKLGLQPRFRKSGWEKLVGAEHLNQGVFFTTSWRTATNWSPALKSGSDAGNSRRGTVAVIRLEAQHLKYEPDNRAQACDCVFVGGTVPVDKAFYLEGRTTGIANWKPLPRLG